MKKVIDLSIGGLKFSLEDDAYELLRTYLNSFEKTIDNVEDRSEVMQDVESRVAEILKNEQSFSEQVINISMIRSVIDHLGEVEIPEADYQSSKENHSTSEKGYTAGKRKIYRNPDGKMLAGICSGFATYLDLDTTIIRIILALLVILGGTGILAYIVLWIVIPSADTVVRQLELRGYAPTAENIRMYKAENKFA